MVFLHDLAAFFFSLMACGGLQDIMIIERTQLEEDSLQPVHGKP